MIKQIEKLPNYAISDDGKFYNKDHKELFQRVNRSGYMVGYRWENNKQKAVSIHREVAKAFIPNPENKPCVNHIDGNKRNNHFSNLEWVTYKENMQHAFATGLKIPAKGENVHNAKLTDELVHQVCKMMQDGYRKCDIIKQTDISEGAYKNIIGRKSWTSISNQYVFKVKNHHIAIESVRWICQMIVLGYKNSEIVDMATTDKITKSIVSKIKRRVCFTEISSEYNF